MQILLQYPADNQLGTVDRIFCSYWDYVGFVHPLSILTAFVVALHPLIAVGWFAGLVQAYIKRPSVRDVEMLTEDIFCLKGFWYNKVTRILLIVTLANIGGSIGSLVGGLEVVRRFINTL